MSYWPTIFTKKLQKSRETYGFTAFSGGPDRIRTDDPHNANVMRSQLRYRPKENIQLLYYTRFLKNVKPNFEDISGERADLEK